jgi:S1-C subfamily serine protease
MKEKLTILLLLFVALLVTSCTYIPNYKNILPRDSFVKLEKELIVKACTPEEGCAVYPFAAVGSGAVIQNTTKGVYVLTAAHVCDESDNKSQFSHIPDAEFIINFYAVSLKGVRKPVKVVNFVLEHDVCILWVKNLFLKPINISPSEPEPGDVVLNIAAPLGIFSYDMVPIFKGFYNGVDMYGRAAYSLPAFGGSSGSPILNLKGELIGMVHSTIREFNNIAVSPNYNAMRSFINDTIDGHMSYRFMRILFSPFM